MYAVIRSGGKQYRVSPGDLLRLEKLGGEVGDRITFEDVLLVSADEETRVGQPIVPGASVVGTIVDQARGDKILVFKFKRRKMYRRKNRAPAASHGGPDRRDQDRQSSRKESPIRKRRGCRQERRGRVRGQHSIEERGVADGAQEGTG